MTGVSGQGQGGSGAATAELPVFAAPVVADLAPFLGRLLRLDPAALVRLRAAAVPGADPAAPATGTDAQPDAADRVVLWSRLPFGVLVSRSVPARPARPDLTLPAARLNQLLALPGGPTTATLDGARSDAAWHWGLPSLPGEAVETVPLADVRRLALAAAQTVRAAGSSGVGGRPVGERVLRDAVLDHVAIEVEDAGRRLRVPQRMIQALARMGFLGSDDADTVAVRSAPGGWVGLSAPYGAAWHRPDGGMPVLRLA